MEKGDIEKLRDNDPKVVKVPGFSSRDMANAIDKLYKKCINFNYDRHYREEINEFWWISMCYQGSRPVLTLSLERWLKAPEINHLRLTTLLLWMCNPVSEIMLNTVINNVTHVRRKKGEWIYAVTGDYTLKGY